jgi:hypothetical protein
VEIAKSGLTEALGWFRKQTSQPATNFQPVLDLLSDPQVLDTEEPDIGIVRQWKITGAVWCRYEVWKDWSADPDPERLAWRNQMLIRDVSAERRAVGSGAVWKLRSIGYVFRRVEPTLAFDQFPNQVIGHEILEMEIRRLSLQPPGQSAVSILDGNSAHINTKGRIIGGSDGAGIFYPQGTGTPTTGPPPPRVTGTPPLSPSLDYYGTVEDVFGVSPEQLTAMADQIITDPDDFPAPVPTNSITVAEVASINFDNARPLQGTGIVYIKGNVTISPGSNSTFNGLLYVDGNLTVRAPSEIRGAVVLTGNLSVQGSSDFATIIYDDDVLSALRLIVGQYRRSTAITLPLVRNH